MAAALSPNSSHAATRIHAFFAAHHAWQERLWRRHAALKFAHEAAAAARARLQRLAQPARDAAAAAQKAAAVAHKAAAAHGPGARGGAKRGASAKQREAASKGASGDGAEDGQEGQPESSLVAGKGVSLSEEEKVALKADFVAAEAAEVAQGYGGSGNRLVSPFCMAGAARH